MFHKMPHHVGQKSLHLLGPSSFGFLKNHWSGLHHGQPSFEQKVSENLFFGLEVNVDSSFGKPSGGCDFRGRRKPAASLAEENAGRLKNAFSPSLPVLFIDCAQHRSGYSFDIRYPSRAAACRERNRVEKADTLLIFPTTTLGLRANIASTPRSATTLAGKILDFRDSFGV